MNILITGASSRLGQAIATDLRSDHRLRLMDEASLEGDDRVEVVHGSILKTDDTWRAVRGMDALIHTGEPPPHLSAAGRERDHKLLDLATRGTHTLFQAGVDAGIKRFIYAGTLSIFKGYADDVYLTEMWKPLPASEMRQMARYLGELTSREFARDFMVTVTGLRLGELVFEEEVQGQATNPFWLDLRDAVQAFRCALDRDKSEQVHWIERWAVYHISAAIDKPKFLIDQARDMGYEPTHNFGNGQ